MDVAETLNTIESLLHAALEKSHLFSQQGKLYHTYHTEMLFSIYIFKCKYIVVDLIIFIKVQFLLKP